MKLINIVAAFISILFINQCIYAQEPDPNSFFPYSVGNVWEYDMPYGEIARIEIIRDSIGNYGLVYLFNGSIFDPSWSFDTTSSIVYFLPTRSNNQYYKLTADSGDTWMVAYEDSSAGSAGRRALVKNKYPSIVFGIPTELMEIEYYELNWGDTVINEISWKINTETLASGFGLILNWYEEPSSLNQILLGCVINGQTFGILTAINDEIQLPGEFYLSQNYPNPFNPSTNIIFFIAKTGQVSLKVYDNLGREVKTLVEGKKNIGVYTVEFNGSGLASGIYIYVLKNNKKMISKKMLLLK